MVDWDLVSWWAVLIVGLVGSALYSGLETGTYSLNRVRLQVMEHQNNARAKVLHHLLHRPVVLLSTLLIGNNLANYMGTAGMAVVLEHAGLTDWQVILVNVMVITPVVLVFGETLPKDLFSAHADRLMYPFARFLQVSRWVFTISGVLPVIKVFSDLLSRLLKTRGPMSPSHPRRYVHALVKEGVGYGVISDEQSAIVQRVLTLGQRTVADEAVPWRSVIKVRLNDPPAALWRLANRTSRSRFPVVDSAGLVVGQISIYDVLSHRAEACPPIAELMAPATTIDAEMPFRQGLTMMQTQRLTLAVVTRGNKPIGVVTVKDLVEAITGELASW